MIYDISIIIVNYKSWDPLTKCLDSILNEKKLNLQVIVLDNNSRDNKFDYFKSRYIDVEWFKNDKNLGFAKACNVGLKNVKSNWVLFLNPDTILTTNCLYNLFNKVKKTKNKIISIKQLNEKELDTYAYGLFLNLYSINGVFRYFYRIRHGLSRKLLSKKQSFSPDWVSGSFMLIRLKDFIKIGGWDEDYWMYYEDMDLCKRAKKINIKTKFYNSLYCYHFHGKSSRIDLKTKIKSKAQVIKSSLIFINKHYKGIYRKILTFLVYFSKVTELILLSPFVKDKRGVLKKILSL